MAYAADAQNAAMIGHEHSLWSQHLRFARHVSEGVFKWRQAEHVLQISCQVITSSPKDRRSAHRKVRALCINIGSNETAALACMCS